MYLLVRRSLGTRLLYTVSYAALQRVFLPLRWRRPIPLACAVGRCSCDLFVWPCVFTFRQLLIAALIVKGVHRAEQSTRFSGD